MDGSTWYRAGYNISYKPSQGYKAGGIENDLQYYTLSFTYRFQTHYDKVWFAYTFPYTYNELDEYLKELGDTYDTILRVNPLC